MPASLNRKLGALVEVVPDQARELVGDALAKAGGNFERAAGALRISRTTLYAYVARLGLGASVAQARSGPTRRNRPGAGRPKRRAS